MEDRDTAEGPAQPFGVVFLKLWIDGLQEGSHQRLLEDRAHDATLVEQVSDYTTITPSQLATRQIVPAERNQP